MNSIALFQLALNLEKPWYVKAVDLKATGKNTLVESEMPMSKVASALRVVDNRLWRVFKHRVEQAVAKDVLEKVERVGIDETSTKKGHQYVTVCADLDTRRVVYVGEGRGAAIVGSLATTLSQKGGSAAKIRAVAIDMSPAYISGVMEHLPNAAITFDKFHIVALLNKSLDELRKGEKKQLEFLKGHKYTFLRHYSSLTEEKRNALDVLLVAYPRLGEAYRLREIFYEFGTYEIASKLKVFLFIGVTWCLIRTCSH